MKDIICPISTKRIDSNVSRLTIFLNVIIMAVFLVTLNPVFILVVAVDYFIRAALDLRYSPLRLIASGGAQTLGLKKHPIDLAPKIFASRLGFICALSAFVLILMDYTFVSMSVAGLLMILSIMDSIFNFCIGCIIYHRLVFPFFKTDKKIAGYKEIS